jgi:uncharacterized protein YjbI with pentapeptide repeats
MPVNNLQKVLAKGAKRWNAWRSKHPKEKSPDLVGADLSGVDLEGADLSGANLMGANLSKANLEKANLSDANLTGADLREASLKGARARGAQLSYAKLEGAQLEGADFTMSTTEKIGGIATYYPEGEAPLGVLPGKAAPTSETLEKLFKGVKHWNKWRSDNPYVKWPDLLECSLPGCDLSGINLAGALLAGAKLNEVNLTNADLKHAVLEETDLGNANLTGADLSSAAMSLARLFGADLTGAKLRDADLVGAELGYANLTNSDLTGANLSDVQLNNTNLSGAILTGCRVHGVAAWRIQGTPGDQSDLIITRSDEPDLTVDNLEVAQFIYLLINNEKIRDVIDTITSKVVLILGRFTDDRIAVLRALREELRAHDFTPILFDFDKPSSKDVTGTVETLARMARFIIADLTDPSSIPHELATIVPQLRTTPIQPLRLAGSGGYGMFDEFQRAYKWVLEVHEYVNSKTLIKNLAMIIAPADEMAGQLRRALPDQPPAVTKKRRGKRRG